MDYSQMPDSELISRYLKGSEEALNNLITKNQERLFGYILSKIQDEDLANDVFQDTFVKIIKTLRAGRYNEEGKFLSWAMRIAHNLVIDHFRRQKRMPTIAPNDQYDIFKVLKDQQLNIEDGLIKEQITSDLRDLIEKLPNDQRIVLKLRYFSELSFKEIADQTDVSINTALGRMRYALINLRKLMEKHRVSLMP